MSSEIPFIRPTFPSAEEIAEAYGEIVTSNWFTNFGPQERRFADGLGDYLGQGLHVATFANGTVALLAAVQSVFGRGDGTGWLLVPSFTFAAAPQAAVWCGYRPAWIDIDPTTWQPSVASAREILARHRDRVVGIVMANVFGVGDPGIAAWEELADEAGLSMVIDSAAGFGSSYAPSERVGGRGRCEIFSFHATKPFAIGEGGALATREAGLEQSAREFQNFGFDRSGESRTIGINGKLQEFNAAIGLLQLQGFEVRLERRRRVHRNYVTTLGDARWDQSLTFQPNAENSSLCFAAACARSPDHRTEVLARWRAAGVQARSYYNPPMHLHAAFTDVAVTEAALQVTEDVCSRVVSIPVHDAMTDEQIEIVLASVRGA